jgi:hypothetical protein
VVGGSNSYATAIDSFKAVAVAGPGPATTLTMMGVG